MKKIQQTKVRAEEVLRLGKIVDVDKKQKHYCKTKETERKRLMEKLNQREAASKAIAKENIGKKTCSCRNET